MSEIVRGESWDRCLGIGLPMPVSLKIEIMFVTKS